MSQIVEHTKIEISNYLSLLSEVRSEGYDIAIKNKFGDELKYILSLKGKSDIELYEERKRLRQEFTYAQ